MTIHFIAVSKDQVFSKSLWLCWMLKNTFTIMIPTKTKKITKRKEEK